MPPAGRIVTGMGGINEGGRERCGLQYIHQAALIFTHELRGSIAQPAAGICSCGPAAPRGAPLLGSLTLAAPAAHGTAHN